MDLSNFTKEFSYLIGTLIIWALTDLILVTKRYLTKRREKRLATVEYTLETHTKLENYLSSILFSMEADRVYLAQLHNGTVTAANMHLCKFSITHEVAQQGVARVKSTLKNIAIEDHLYVIRMMVDRKAISISSVENLEMSLTKALWMSMGCVSTALIPIRNRDKIIVGFVGIDFTGVEVDLNSSDNRKALAGVKDTCGMIELALIC